MKSVTWHETILRTMIGDLTRQDTDAIVNPANSALIMGGGVAGAIKRAGGTEIEDEAVNKAPVPVGRAVETRAGRLPAKFVIHSPTMPWPAMQTDERAVRKATNAALTHANEMKLRTISFPGMGTGVGGVGAYEAAKTMIDEIKHHIGTGTTLKEIRLICRDESLLKAFKDAISELSNE